MVKKQPVIPAEYIVPLNMNKLRGRMLRLPAPKTKRREVLLVYGHHSSLERWYGMAQLLNEYGAVTMPDLPGFGGMDSFYKIGLKPDIDTMADYLASIVKLRFRGRRITMVGISYGFLVITRMLQKYPDIVPKIDILMSIAGFAHHEDLLFTTQRKRFYRTAARIFCTRPTASVFRNIALHPAVLRAVYHKTHNAKHKFKGYDEEEKKHMTDFEIVLWRCNDVRTYMRTTLTMLSIDNCKNRVNLPVHHIGVEADNYFDNRLVEQHMQVIFDDFTLHSSSLDRHVPSILATKKDMKSFMPSSAKKIFKG